jgi:hypothetical protein
MINEKFKNGFNWDIVQAPIYDQHGNVINGYKEVSRKGIESDEDDGTIAVMKKSYNPITTEKFTNIVEGIASSIGADIAGYTDWSNGSAMGKSRQVITAQIKLSEALSIAGSKIEGYLTIGTGFDGQRSFYVGHTNEYLRCSNQFGSIITEMTARLTKNVLLKVDDIVKNIEIYTEYEKNLYETFKRFQDVKIDERLIQECIGRVAGLTDEERAMPMKQRFEEVTSQKLNKMDEIAASVRGEIADLGDNAWALFNGITHYTTHVMSSRTNESFGNVFGAKNTANQKAYKFCSELLKA